MRLASVVVGFGLLLLLMRSALARTTAIDASTGLPDVDLIDAAPSEPAVSDDTGALTGLAGSGSDNLGSFLYAMVASEHNRADLLSGDAYNRFYGGQSFTDLSNHPVLTGELRGVPLPADWCVRAGFADGHCVSTAAGAYQFNVPTWLEANAWGDPLPDFSPTSQDEAARRILDKIGALDAIYRGDITSALLLASRRWASLPGSKAGQRVRTPAFFASMFTEGLNRQA